jgi:hypothetical protein
MALLEMDLGSTDSRVKFLLFTVTLKAVATRLRISLLATGCLDPTYLDSQVQKGKPKKRLRT